MKKLILLFLSLLFSTSLFAQNFKEIVVLGDSLSDNGNLYAALKIIPKSPPYFKGRFSNGTTWAENVGKYFYNKSFIDYKIYAWGGATAILHSIITDPFISPINLDGELNLYLMNSLFKDKSKVLYFIWIGANDYLYERHPNLEMLTTRVTNKIASTMQVLMFYGARHFVVMNLPDLSKTPFAREHLIDNRLQKLTNLHNQKLDAAMSKLRNKHSKVTITTIDVYSIFNDVLSDAQKYNQKYNTNITNIKDACWQGGMTLHDEAKLNSELQQTLAEKNQNFDSQMMAQYILNSPSLALAYSMTKSNALPCSNAEQYIFWDALHPSSTIHEILGKIVVEVIEKQYQ